jgi:hypothetical protein
MDNEEQARSHVVDSQVRQFAREMPSVDGQPVYEM